MDFLNKCDGILANKAAVHYVIGMYLREWSKEMDFFTFSALLYKLYCGGGTDNAGFGKGPGLV